eukprot:scaffold302642_cov28-Tisochrysis_lutea.AAC.2
MLSSPDNAGSHKTSPSSRAASNPLTPPAAGNARISTASGAARACAPGSGRGSSPSRHSATACSARRSSTRAGTPPPPLLPLRHMPDATMTSPRGQARSAARSGAQRCHHGPRQGAPAGKNGSALPPTRSRCSAAGAHHRRTGGLRPHPCCGRKRGVVIAAQTRGRASRRYSLCQGPGRTRAPPT